MNIIKKLFKRTKKPTDEEIIEYIYEVLDEYNDQLYNFEFEVIDKTHPEYEEFMKALYEEKIDIIKKIMNIGILKYIPKCIKENNLAIKILDKIFKINKMALTVTKEKQDIDIILFIIDNIREDYNMIDKDWKKAIRILVRHELRHVAQFIELRKRGGEEYVIKALSLTDKYGYLDSPIELDAYANQDKELQDQFPIEIAVDEIVKSFD